MDNCQRRDARASDAEVGERRSEFRERSILRLAIIDCGRSTQLCRITNISLHGLQATVFGSVTVGSDVSVRVPDEIALDGKIMWVRDRSIGIKLDTPLDHSALLRLSGDANAHGKRRRLPRVQASAPACLRSGGHTYAVELVDISPSGAMVRTAARLPGLGPIVLDALGLPRIAGQIRWLGESRAGILFNTQVPLDALTEWLRRLYAEEQTKEPIDSREGTDGTTMDDRTSMAS